MDTKFGYHKELQFEINLLFRHNWIIITVMPNVHFRHKSGHWITAQLVGKIGTDAGSICAAMHVLSRAVALRKRNSFPIL